jgi:predicted deacylase
MAITTIMVTIIITMGTTTIITIMTTPTTKTTRVTTTAMTTEAMPRIKVELKAPDIDPHRASNTGTDYVHTFDSGVPGPHVMVNALTHGNEICGAIVVDQLLRARVRPTKGRLTLAFANVAAFLRFDPANPYATRFVDEDFNRVWTPSTLDGKGATVELKRARELRPFIDAAEYLLDIHSMLEPSPPVMICGPLDKGIRFAFEVGIPEHVVSDAGPFQWHPHARLRRVRRSRQPEERLTRRMRPALGAGG